MKIFSNLLIIFVLLFHATYTVHPDFRKFDSRIVSELDFGLDVIKPFGNVKFKSSKKKSSGYTSLLWIEFKPDQFLSFNNFQTCSYHHFTSSFTLRDNDARAPPILS